MSNVSITYDLVAPGRDYQPLIETIKSLGAWCRPTKSQWIVATNASAAAILDALLPFIDQNDRLFVAILTGETAWWNLPAEVSGWLRGVPASA